MFDLLIPVANAQAAPAAGNPITALIFPVFLLLIFYFMLIRPQMKRAKEHRAMVADLKVGDEVLTTGGLYGKIKSVEEGTVDLTLSQGVEVRLQKSAVTAVLPKGSIKK